MAPSCGDREHLTFLLLQSLSPATALSIQSIPTVVTCVSGWHGRQHSHPGVQILPANVAAMFYLPRILIQEPLSFQQCAKGLIKTTASFRLWGKSSQDTQLWLSYQLFERSDLREGGFVLAHSLREHSPSWWRRLLTATMLFTWQQPGSREMGMERTGCTIYSPQVPPAESYFLQEGAPPKGSITTHNSINIW